MHILIVAHSGTGKGSLMKRIISCIGRSVRGYETVKEDTLAEDGRGSPIYIYEYGKPRIRSSENLAGYCLNHHAVTFPEAFDRFAPKLRAPVPANHLLVLDEIGPMESKSPVFCEAVLKLLDGEVPVLAAVRDKDTAFLNTVRNHPNVKCFRLTADNRDEIYKEAIRALKEASA